MLKPRQSLNMRCILIALPAVKASPKVRLWSDLQLLNIDPILVVLLVEKLGIEMLVSPSQYKNTPYILVTLLVLNVGGNWMEVKVLQFLNIWFIYKSAGVALPHIVYELSAYLTTNFDASAL